MAKKKSEDDLYKEFCRTLFSSLSGRRARYLYTGPDMGSEYTLVLSNGADEMIMAYNSCELALHIVTVLGENQKYIDKFWEEMNIPKDAFYQFDTEVFLKVQKLNLINDIVRTPDGTMHVDLGDAKGPSVLGRYVGNFYLSVIFRNLFEGLHGLTDEYLEQHPAQVFTIDPEMHNKGVVCLPVETELYTHKTTNEQIFQNKQDTVHVILLDGLDTISMKELPKKLSGETNIRLCTWVGAGQFIRYATITENENLTVRSSRPHLCIFPPFKYIEPKLATETTNE